MEFQEFQETIDLTSTQIAIREAITLLPYSHTTCPLIPSFSFYLKPLNPYPFCDLAALVRLLQLTGRWQSIPLPFFGIHITYGRPIIKLPVRI